MKILLFSLVLTVFTFASEIKVGDVVFGSNVDHDMVGTVNSVGTGAAEVTWTMFDGEPYGLDAAYTWNIENLHKITRCHNDICSGDIISALNGDGESLEGQANRVFENGIAEIQWNKSGGKAVNFGRYNYWNTRSVKLVPKSK